VQAGCLEAARAGAARAGAAGPGEADAGSADAGLAGEPTSTIQPAIAIDKIRHTSPMRELRRMHSSRF